MREFQFAVQFEEGTDALMDVFHEYPGLVSRSSACFTTDDSMWRIDNLLGSSEALSAVTDVFTDRHRCNECLDSPGCETYREYHLLDERPTSRTVYTYRHEVSECHSVPFIVHDHVGDGVVFESLRAEGEYRWRVLYPGEQSIGDLRDALDGALRPGLSLRVSHVSEAGAWDTWSRAAAHLSHDHWEVLKVAHEHGYYARPREVTVEELADHLDVPRSTVQYRLRSAEDRVLSQFVESTL